MARTGARGNIRGVWHQDVPLERLVEVLQPARDSEPPAALPGDVHASECDGRASQVGSPGRRAVRDRLALEQVRADDVAGGARRSARWLVRICDGAVRPVDDRANGRAPQCPFGGNGRGLRQARRCVADPYGFRAPPGAYGLERHGAGLPSRCGDPSALRGAGREHAGSGSDCVGRDVADVPSARMARRPDGPGTAENGSDPWVHGRCVHGAQPRPHRRHPCHPEDGRCLRAIGSDVPAGAAALHARGCRDTAGSYPGDPA